MTTLFSGPTKQSNNELILGLDIPLVAPGNIVDVMDFTGRPVFCPF
jgi:hypothetical protein